MDSDESPALPAGQQRTLFAAIAVAILVAAAALRIAGARSDLWLDEIGALAIADHLESPLHVFTRVHHEVNHYLNTLWLWAAGDHGNWFGYRVPSLIAGIATVLLAGAIGRRRSPVTGLFAMAAVGASYPLVSYSSEVRGYATCVFFAFLCFDLLGRWLRRPRAALAAGYAAAAIGGLASHVIFATVVFAGLVWTVERSWVERRTLRATLGGVATCHLPPLLFLAWLYFVDIRRIEIGGGTVALSFVDSYGTALAWSLGTPVDPRAQLVVCILAVVVLLAGLRVVARQRPDPRAFFVGAIVVFPVLLTILRGSDLLYTRHFLLAIAFLILLLGFVLADLFEAGPRRRGIAGLALAVFCVANGRHIAGLVRYGRGTPSLVVRYLDQQTGTVIHVAGDHELRIGRVLAYHWKALGETKLLDYQHDGAWAPEGPDWLILHKESYLRPVPDDALLQDKAGHRYALEAIFPAAPLSGMHWFVYRNVARR